MNPPIRTAVLGGRLSNAWSPLAIGANSPISVAGYQHQPCRRSALRPSPLKQQPIRASSCATTYKSPARPASLSSNTCRATYNQSSTNNSTLLSAIRRSQSCPGLRRNTSTSTQTASSGNHHTNTVDTPVKLDWNTFFQLRASRRKYSLISSVLAAFTTTAAGGQILATQNLENLGAQIMGFDPLIVLGLATAASGALGWLAGPFLGNGLWGLVYRKYKSAVAIKEKEFYNRIKRFRVDPSANSFANPVPDYYGEKIGSVQGYRQWLKDQRAYNRKKRRFV
ncbi:presequence translocated-associated motor subunit pam17 [Nannizzia gypsea CBS 118893]|uniref:Presequence translocated-associated motor subunit PAM17 n=1 Tax=Arthroderma gypseum (strain ATCC MYA-4604 / CBS 118893) TaxID=535722 RepID=E4UZL0_ARTGP|nr:presequence translocated-associated motor subunit pam17 [Nannizzia gypsea CBS 118893]EFR03540.1 presequence translocated-associated motor subunit pam17 [Nannizzia gypsea CBS 118893]